MGARALDQQVELLYDELKRLARSHMSHERADHTLSASALVSEAYLRLHTSGAQWESRAHFFGMAARTMRRVLIEHARARSADRRGGDWARVTLTLSHEEVQRLADAGFDDLPVPLLDLDRALCELADRDPRQAQIVELRYFGGLSNEEVAQVLGISLATLKRDWLVARLFLRRALQG